MKKHKNIAGFKAPENYFENIETQLFSKIEAEKLPKTAEFKVPENYFESLDQRVLNAVTASEKPSKVIPLFPKKYFGYAAAIAAGLILGVSLFNDSAAKSTLDTLQLAAIDKYIEEGNLNMDIFDLTSFIDDEYLNQINFESKQISDKTLETYILENVDEETLINE